jgi:hypothetical protein
VNDTKNCIKAANDYPIESGRELRILSVEIRAMIWMHRSQQAWSIQQVTGHTSHSFNGIVVPILSMIYERAGRKGRNGSYGDVSNQLAGESFVLSMGAQ